MGNHAKDTEVAKLEKREKALRKVYGGKTITLSGQQLTGQAMAEKCTQLIAGEGAVDAAYRTWREAVATRDAMRASTAPLFQSLQSLVQATYGKSSQAVADFGFKPVEKAARSAEVKAQAVVKLPRHPQGAQHDGQAAAQRRHRPGAEHARSRGLI